MSFLHKIMRDAAANTCTTSTHRPSTNCAPVADPPSLDATAVTTAPTQQVKIPLECSAGWDWSRALRPLKGRVCCSTCDSDSNAEQAQERERLGLHECYHDDRWAQGVRCEV